jgi:hypothetical protein
MHNRQNFHWLKRLLWWISFIVFTKIGGLTMGIMLCNSSTCFIFNEVEAIDLFDKYS